MSGQVPAVVKAVRLLEAVVPGDGRENMATLARQADLAPSTCFRILQTLVAADWLQPTGEGGYLPSAGLVRLAEAMSPQRRLIAGCGGPMQRLAQATGLAVKLVVRQGLDQLTLHRVESNKPLAVTGRVGTRFPVVFGASGAALLADLDEQELNRLVELFPKEQWEYETPELVRERVAACREDGWCSNVGQHPQGIDTLAGAVRDEQGQVVGGLTLIGLRGDLAGRALAEAAAALREALEACRRGLLAEMVCSGEPASREVLQ